KSSRSHARATEIWESASLAPAAPPAGWLGRYLDSACSCGPDTVAGVQFGDSLGLTLASESARSRLIGHPELLSRLDAEALRRTAARGPDTPRFAELAAAQAALADSAAELARATKGSGSRYAYPATPFGQALRWTGNLIEAESPVRASYVSIGSFAQGD